MPLGASPTWSAADLASTWINSAIGGIGSSYRRGAQRGTGRVAPVAAQAARGARTSVLSRRSRGRDRPIDGHQPRHGQIRQFPGARRARAATSGGQVNTLEDRLRAATRAAARTVPDGSARPLVLPAPRRRRTAVPGGRAWRQWMAPIAAAAAVLAVVMGLLAITGLLPGRPTVSHAHRVVFAGGGRI